MNETRNTSLAYMRRGTQRIPVVARPQCKTCSSPHRGKIERLFIDGLTPRRIIARLPEGEDLSERSIRRHHNRGHLPVDHKMVLRRIDVAEQKRWDEIGHDATEIEIEAALRQQAIALVGLEQLALDEMTITAADVLSAARFLHEKEVLAELHQDEVDRHKHNRDLVVRDLRYLLEIVGEVLGDDARNRVFHSASTDPRTSTTLHDRQFVGLRDEKDDRLDAMTRDERRAAYAAVAPAA